MTDEPGRDRFEATDEHQDASADDPDEIDEAAADADDRPSFSTAFRGYNTDEVDRYLVEMLERDALRAESFERLQAELEMERAQGTASVDSERARLQAELEAERARHHTERAQLDNVRASLEARVVALEHELERLRGELDATRGALPEIESLRSRLETLTSIYEQRVSALDALIPYVAREIESPPHEPEPEPESEPEPELEASFAAAIRPDEPDEDEPDEDEPGEGVSHPMARDPESRSGTAPTSPVSDDAPEDVWRGNWQPDSDVADKVEPSGGTDSRSDRDDAIGWDPGARSAEEDEDPSGEGSGPSTPQ